MSRLIKLLVCAAMGAGLSVSPAAFGEGPKQAGTGPNPFRDCGIGAALFPTVHWAAITSNIIWDIGTTAITSATASPETCSGKTTKVAQFIVDTYGNVVDETARGDGEHLTAMLNLYGCAPAVHGDIVAAIRPAIGEQLTQPGHATLDLTDKSEQYFLLLDTQVKGRFAASCQA